MGQARLQELEKAGHMCLQSEIRERGGDREKERDRDRNTQRETDRHRETVRHAERNEGRHTLRHWGSADFLLYIESRTPPRGLSPKEILDHLKRQG